MINKFLLVSLIFVLSSCNNKDEKQISEAIAINDSIDAIQKITLDLRENSNNAELFFKRAEEYQKINKYQKAIEDIELSIAIDSLEPKYYLKAVDLYLMIGKSSVSKRYLEKADVKFPKNTDVLLKFAHLNFYVKQYTESMEFINKVLKIDRNIAEAYFLKALIYQENNDTLNSLKNLHLAVESKVDYYDAYILLGLLNTNSEDTITLDYYRNAIKISPQNVEPYYNMAIFYQERNLQKQAINTYNYIINSIDSNYVNSYYNLGYIYMIENQNYKKSLEYFKKSIDLKPDYIEAYNNLAYCYEQLKQYNLAIDNYKKCLEIIPNYDLAISGLNRLDKLK